MSAHFLPRFPLCFRAFCSSCSKRHIPSWAHVDLCPWSTALWKWSCEPKVVSVILTCCNCVSAVVTVLNTLREPIICTCMYSTMLIGLESRRTEFWLMPTCMSSNLCWISVPHHISTAIMDECLEADLILPFHLVFVLRTVHITALSRSKYVCDFKPCPLCSEYLLQQC